MLTPNEAHLDPALNPRRVYCESLRCNLKRDKCLARWLGLGGEETTWDQKSSNEYCRGCVVGRERAEKELVWSELEIEDSKIQVRLNKEAIAYCEDIMSRIKAKISPQPEVVNDQPNLDDDA